MTDKNVCPPRLLLRRSGHLGGLRPFLHDENKEYLWIDRQEYLSSLIASGGIKPSYPMKTSFGMNDQIKITRRHLPHWELKGATYFITFRTSRTLLSLNEIEYVLNHVKIGNGKFYTLIAAVVLEDHVHLVIKPMEGYNLSRILKGIKGVTARQINLGRSNRGSVWQAESFDRIIRSLSDFEEKLNYMWNNPVKLDLADEPQKYPGWFFNEEYEEYVSK